MINVVTVDADGNERTVDMGDETTNVEHRGQCEGAGCQICSFLVDAAEKATKPKRARNRVATKTTVTKTIEKELTFTEADLRRMLRIPEGATLLITDSGGEQERPFGGNIVATWTVTR